MVRLNIHQAKTHLSRYLKLLERGETILLCRHNVPIAEIRPIPSPPKKRRPVGLAKGEFELTASFFEPMPEWFVRGFEGEEG